MKNLQLITPPHEEISQDKLFVPEIHKFIHELRVNVLKITINELVYNMNLSNEKYYQQIVNGYKDKNGILKYKQPTIKYIFSGLNYAINNFDNWKSKREQIINLIFKYIIKF